MQFTGSGFDFEERFFGVRSSGLELVRRFEGEIPDFQSDMTHLIEEPGVIYPETDWGRSFYFSVRRELERLGINAEDLIFRPAVDTKVDLFHYTDGVFHLPSVYRYPVTIDAFNIDSSRLRVLRSFWIDSHNRCCYTERDFQRDLFKHKKGLAVWRKEGSLNYDGFDFGEKIDFRQYSPVARPLNHFVATPLHICNYQYRRAYAKFVASYIAQVAGRDPAENTA